MRNTLRVGLSFQQTLADAGAPRLTPDQFDVYLQSVAPLASAPRPGDDHPEREALIADASRLSDLDDELVTRWMAAVLPGLHHAKVRDLEARLARAREDFNRRDKAGENPSSGEVIRRVEALSTATAARDLALATVPARARSDVAEVEKRLAEERARLHKSQSPETRTAIAEAMGPEEADRIVRSAVDGHKAWIATLEARLALR